MRLSANGRLFLISFAILFLEICLIRWVSTEIRIFAYVHNLVLLACFLGIGVGAYHTRRHANLGLTTLNLGLLVALVTAPIEVSIGGMRLHPLQDIPAMLSVYDDSLIWYEAVSQRVLLFSGLGIGMTLLIFAVILVMFLPLGQMLGAAFAQHHDVLFAYSLNIAASVAGIWALNLLSLGWLPPWVWFAGFLIVICPLYRWSVVNTALMALCLAAIVLMGMSPSLESRQVLWSPYQKLEPVPMRDDPGHGEYLVQVNNKGFMHILDLSPGHLGMHLGGDDLAERQFGQYDVPYLFARPEPDVLIVGAGAGNDAAGALRNGARAVIAVEIDPGIQRLGRDLHPERPYDDSRVEVVIEDARSYIRRTDRKFDLISFGLLDAHTLSSSYNNVRLDHYVYTREAFEEARSLLRAGGVLSVVFASQRPWMVQRIAGLLREAFDAEPIAIDVRNQERFGFGGDMFIVSDDMAALRARVSGRAELSDFVRRNRIGIGATPRLTTDDWPYFYLEDRRIPTLHLVVSGILAALFAVLRFFVIPSGKKIQMHFFLLGAAFLLLEFQNISKMQLLLGSTWLINSFAISGILGMILLANYVAHRWPEVRMNLAYAGLFVSILIIFLVPLDAFQALPYMGRGICGSLLLSLPILFSGIIFITSFRQARDRSLALGSNILGAGIGGLLESITFVTGIHLVLVLVAALYLGSLAALRR